jgi:hypothetical protein
VIQTSKNILMELLVKQLAIRLSEQTTLAKSLVMVKQLAIRLSEQTTLAKTERSRRVAGYGWAPE